MIFSRGRGAGRHAKDDGTGHADQPDLAKPRVAAEPARPDRAAGIGPYDASDGRPEVPHLDLGALRIPATEGVEVRMQADNDGAIQQVVLVHKDSVLQLGVFAAPRSDGIWAEVREEIRAQLSSDGVQAEEIEGEYGTQLQARVSTPEGTTDLRFVGVDGPRWMVRAVFQGPVAVDPSIAAPLLDCLHGLVVDRGNEAMPVREALPLRLPREVADQAEAAAAAAAANGATPAPTPAVTLAPGSAPGSGTAPAPDGVAGLTGGDSVGPAVGGTPRRKPSPRPRRR